MTVNVCRTPLVKDCDQEGEEICTTEYESECVTEQHEHQVEDDVPECKTVQNRPCVFPFSYRGVTYDECTYVDSDNGWHWCATQVGILMNTTKITMM